MRNKMAINEEPSDASILYHVSDVCVCFDWLIIVAGKSEIMKLVVSVVLLAFVAFVAADNCDSLQRFKVKHQWSEAFGEGHHRLEFGVKLFKA